MVHAATPMTVSVNDRDDWFDDLAAQRFVRRFSRLCVTGALGGRSKRGKVTNAGVAAAMGLDESTISRLRNGTRLPTVGHLILISKKANVSIDWLLGFTGRSDPEPGFSPEDVRRILTRMNETTRAALEAALENALAQERRNFDVDR